MTELRLDRELQGADCAGEVRVKAEVSAPAMVRETTVVSEVSN